MTDASDPRHPDEPVANRRQFFLRGLSKSLEGLLGLAPKALPPVGEGLLGAQPSRSLLRPPGALREGEFLRTCYRCGSCVDSCRFHAIRVVQGPDSAAPKMLEPPEDELAGTPYIDPDLQACQWCHPMPCVQACPSGALAAANTTAMRIGMAQWVGRNCLRTAGQKCQVCVEKCPVGLTTLHVNRRGEIEVVGEQCVGCGVCQQMCPARPKAIFIRPL